MREALGVITVVVGPGEEVMIELWNLACSGGALPEVVTGIVSRCWPSPVACPLVSPGLGLFRNEL